MHATRRTLLRGTAALSACAGLPAWLRAAAAHAEDAPVERTLVVLQLSGGNDGLSTVVPYEDDLYHRARRTTRVPAEEVLRIEPLLGLGLHPGLQGLRRLYDEGQAAWVLGVGYPRASRSHFTSMDVWHTASPRGRSEPAGWLGRAVERLPGGVPRPESVVSVGEDVPYALRAPAARPVSFRRAEALRWMGTEASRGAFDALNAPPAEGRDGDLGARLHRAAADARAASERVRSAVSSYAPKAAYPASALAGDLRAVAALLGAGVPLRVATVAHGGYDTHTGQRARHDRLMRELSEALSAFQADLRAQGLDRRVVLLAFSEFGRRVEENASQGTDHGAAGPVLLLGRPVRGGCQGRQPSLARLDEGDLAHTTDFRRVYATLLERWLGVDSVAVLGARHELLPLLA